MARVSATASMGLKLKIFSDYENVSPHASITIERDLGAGSDEQYTDAALVEMAAEMYEKCRKYVESEMEKDIAFAKSGKDGKYIGKKVK